jgi:hypothetical protein
MKAIVGVLIILNLAVHANSIGVTLDLAPRSVPECRADLASVKDLKSALDPSSQGFDCTGCEVVDSEHDHYCEKRRDDECGDPRNWFDDDFKWIRRVNIVRCRNNEQYRRCGVWRRNDCCPAGIVGPPPSQCDPKNGRQPCRPLTGPDPDPQ